MQAADGGEETIAVGTAADVNVLAHTDGFDINKCFHDQGLQQGGRVFATVVASEGETSYKGLQVVRSAQVAICALKSRRKKATDAIIVIAAFLAAQDVQLLRRAGADYICDASGFDTKSMYHPYSGTDTQGRRDGAMTYYKFLLFNLTSVGQVLYFDADVAMLEDPSYILDSVSTDVEIVATREGHQENTLRPYGGWNDHIMFVRPSERRFNNLVFRAKTGNYRPYTNTEQDVVENEFAPDFRGFNELGMPREPLAAHNFRYELDSDRKNFCPDDL